MSSRRDRHLVSRREPPAPGVRGDGRLEVPQSPVNVRCPRLPVSASRSHGGVCHASTARAQARDVTDPVRHGHPERATYPAASLLSIVMRAQQMVEHARCSAARALRPLHGRRGRSPVTTSCPPVARRAGASRRRVRASLGRRRSPAGLRQDPTLRGEAPNRVSRVRRTWLRVDIEVKDEPKTLVPCWQRRPRRHPLPQPRLHKDLLRGLRLRRAGRVAAKATVASTPPTPPQGPHAGAARRQAAGPIP